MARTRYCPRCLTTFADAPPTCPNLGCRSASPDPWPTLLQPGDLLDRTYRIEQTLAGGAAGMTYRARELGDDDAPTGPELAIKVLYAQRDSGPFVRRLATEAQILQSLDHPHILECRGFVHRMGKAPYLITRFEAGGTLHDHVARVGPLPTSVAARVLLQIVDALKVAHAVDVVHRDLKPANVLLGAEVAADQVPHVRIADFGIAKVQGGLGNLTRVGAFVGTPEYAAPEQFLGQDASAATDLFAAAGMLWFLLTGEQPLRVTQRHDPVHTHDEVLEQLPPQLPKAVRATEAGLRLQSVIDGLMVADPAQRAPVTEVLDALEDAAEADGSGALARPAPVVGTGGTVFVHEDAPETFIWMPEPEAPPPESPPAEPESPASPVRAPTLIAPPDEPSLDAPAPAPQPKPTPAPAPPTTRGDSTMEGLFDFNPSSTPSAPLPEPAAPPTSPAPTSSIFDEAPTPGRAPDETVVQPHQAPVSLPTDPMAILALLGSGTHEQPVIHRLTTWDADEAGRLLRQARRHPDPDTRAGALRAVVALERTDLTSLGRGLLRDPIASVRAQAATMLGHLAGGSLLPPLARLLDDESALVRAAAAPAVAQAYLRDGDTRRARHLLTARLNDPEASVQAAVTQAIHTLDAGPA